MFLFVRARITVSRILVAGCRGQGLVRRKRVVLHVVWAYRRFVGHNGFGLSVANAIVSSGAKYGLRSWGHWWNNPYEVKLFGLVVTQSILTDSRYRAPKSTRGPTDADTAATGFLDGDFIEQFLSLMGSKEIVGKIMTGTSDPEKLKVKVEELQTVVESLQSMH